MITRKSRGSFANPHWLTGTLGFDFGLDPIWAVDARSDGQDGLGVAGGGAGDWRRARGGGGSPDLAVNGRPSSDSRAGWSGSELGRWRTPLGVRWSRGRPDRGTRRRGAERRRRRAQASGTEGERRGKGAGDIAHHDAELRGCVADEDRRRNGGSAARRGAPRSSNYGAAAARV